jgi:hypothetical protein
MTDPRFDGWQWVVMLNRGWKTCTERRFDKLFNGLTALKLWILCWSFFVVVSVFVVSRLFVGTVAIDRGSLLVGTLLLVGWLGRRRLFGG